MSTLQELLNLGLVEIGSDDSRFDKMQSASSALSARFKEEPRLLIPATLISLDEGVDEDEPMFALVEELVVAEWKTLRNTHVNRPRELLRSTIIDALANTVAEDPISAGIVWGSAAAPLRHSQVRLGKAASIIEMLVKNTCKLAEEEAVARSGFITSAPKKRKKKKPSSTKKLSFNISAEITDDEIVAGVASSAGPNHPEVPNLENPNPHWPNQGQQWSHEFATRMATAIANAVNSGNSHISKSLSEQLAGYLGEFKNQITEQLSQVKQLQDDTLQTHESRNMRLEVLWWSDALYSPVMQVGYRELDIPVAAVAAAVDLASIVPPHAPASACYVLGETLLRITQFNSNDDEITVHAYLDGIANTKLEFGDLLPVLPTNTMRLPLVGLVSESVANSHVSPEDVRKRAGIDPSLKLSPAEFAMWVFRGIQANRLVEVLK